MIPESADFELELVTPAFLRGTDDGEAELRPASIRGLLRWWLRAVEGGRGPLSAVRRLESALFGETAGEEGRQGKVLLRVGGALRSLPPGRPAPDQDPIQERTSGGVRRMNPIAYLGYGPYRGNVTTRACLEPGRAFSVRLLFRQALAEPERAALGRAVWAWTRLGGLGSRARRGFGSVHLRDGGGELLGALPAGAVPAAADLAALLGGRDAGQPAAYTHLTAAARLFRGPVHDHATDALGWLGHAWKGARNHVRDQTNDRHNGQTRALLGLPLQVPGRTVRLPGLAGSDPRRASPVLLRVSKEDRAFVPLVLVLPGRFHPEAPRLQGEAERALRLALEHLEGTPGMERIW